MKKENISYIIDQLESMEEAFDTLRDCCFCIKSVLQDELDGKSINDINWQKPLPQQPQPQPKTPKDVFNETASLLKMLGVNMTGDELKSELVQVSKSFMQEMSKTKPKQNEKPTK